MKYILLISIFLSGCALGQGNAVNGKGGGITDPTAFRAALMLGDSATSDAADLPVSNATQAALDGKAASVHTHAASDVNSGTFADARISQSSVTQHQAALSLSSSQISDASSAGINLLTALFEADQRILLGVQESKYSAGKRERFTETLDSGDPGNNGAQYIFLGAPWVGDANFNLPAIANVKHSVQIRNETGNNMAILDSADVGVVTLTTGQTATLWVSGSTWKYLVYPSSNGTVALAATLNEYLRLDGSEPMQANLNMGLYSIDDVGDITATGAITTGGNTVATLQGNETSPGNKVFSGTVEVSAEDLVVSSVGKGFVVKSPDGNLWRITVDNAGSLITTDLTP